MGVILGFIGSGRTPVPPGSHLSFGNSYEAGTEAFCGGDRSGAWADISTPPTEKFDMKLFGTTENGTAGISKWQT